MREVESVDKLKYMSYRSYPSYSPKETKKLAKNFAEGVFEIVGPIIISLEGDLGAGKTTFTQGFAGGLGIREKIQSPTFVILKIYDIPKSRKNFIHVDAYRLKAEDFKILGWKEFIKNPENIILVEWGNRIKKILPKKTIRILFEHGKKSSERYVKVNL